MKSFRIFLLVVLVLAASTTVLADENPKNFIQKLVDGMMANFKKITSGKGKSEPVVEEKVEVVTEIKTEEVVEDTLEEEVDDEEEAAEEEDESTEEEVTEEL
jgi:hypothetical protein